MGRPNVGKSTLLNRLLGQKVAIVTPKPQTTRHRVLGIKTLPDAQIVFVDTPGLHRARSLINRRMVEAAERAAADADIIVWVLDATAGLATADRDIAETFDRAYRMLRMRRVLSRAGDGYAVLPNGRPLISYYANSIVHLLGPFADGVRARDALPVDHALGAAGALRAGAD